jgi:FAD/FMN-containing dehydrogenase
LWFQPRNLAELANAILIAERAGHHVRAFGNRWSMSDAVCATDGGVGATPGAMIGTDLLAASLQPQLPQLLADGVDATSLFHVEAGISMSALQPMLDKQAPPQALAAGGGSGQTLGGMISTSTHSGDSAVPPLGDSVQAIHLVGAGGVEHWIERDDRITTRSKLRAAYPCLAWENIHYDTRLFNAVMISAGSMGVIYSVILKTVPQFGLLEHRVLTTWQTLLPLAGPGVGNVLDGSLLSNWNFARDGPWWGRSLQRTVPPERVLTDCPQPVSLLCE